MKKRVKHIFIVISSVITLFFLFLKLFTFQHFPHDEPTAYIFFKTSPYAMEKSPFVGNRIDPSLTVISQEENSSLATEIHKEIITWVWFTFPLSILAIFIIRKFRLSILTQTVKLFEKLIQLKSNMSLYTLFNVIKIFLFIPPVGLFILFSYVIVVTNVNHTGIPYHFVHYYLAVLVAISLLQIAVTKSLSRGNKIALAVIIFLFLFFFSIDHFNVMLGYEDWCKRGMP